MLSKKRADIAEAMEEAGVQEELHLMELDSTLKTESSYSANAALYPNHQIPFVDKHMAYLINHPDLDPKKYLSNLRLMIKIRR